MNYIRGGIAGLIFMAFNICMSYADEPLVLTMHKLPPLSTKSANGEMDHLVVAAFKKLNIPVVLKWYEQVRALELLRDNKVDGTFPRFAGVAEENDNLIKVAYPIFHAGYVAYAKDPDISLKSWTDLKKHKAVYLKGWRVFESNPVVMGNARPIAHRKDLLHLFEHGKADIVLFDKLTFPLLAAQYDVSDYHVASPVLDVKPLYLILNKSHSKLADQLGEVFKNMYKHGEYQQLCPNCLQSENVGS